MATKDDTMRDPEFEAAFNEDAPSAQGDSGGLNLEQASGDSDTPAAASADAAETASAPDGEPAAVVIMAEEGAAASGEGASTEVSANETAAAEAKSVNDEANAAASDNKSPAATTGEQEAGKTGSETGNQDSATGDESVADAPEAVGEEIGSDVVSDAPHGEQPVGDADPYDLSDVPPEDMQKAKSWVGRLKKLEADLKAKGTAAGEKPAEATVKAADDLEKVATEALGENAELADAADAAAMDVASGKMTPDEARRRLAEDFGEEFLGYIETIARDYASNTAQQAVGDRLSKIEQDTQGVIDHLRNSADRAHYQAIYDAHPDFVDVQQDAGFQEFVTATGQQAVVENGSSAAINKLLADYKATKPDPAAEQASADGATPAQDAVAAAADAPAQVDQASVDAAEGVRSAGLRLPDRPGRADDDFASAWDKF